MTLILVWLHSIRNRSMVDWLVTRFYRAKEWCMTQLWKVGLSNRTPPCELDLTELLDAADLKNKQLDAFK